MELTCASAWPIPEPVGEGAGMAQMTGGGEETGITLCFTTDTGQRGELEAILREEKQALPPSAGPRAMTLSKVTRYVTGLGVDLYWARHQLGRELDAFAQTQGLDRRGALLEALRRGLRKGGKK